MIRDTIYCSVPIDQSHHTLFSNENDEENSSNLPNMRVREFDLMKFLIYTWNSMTFNWVNPLLTLGNQKSLDYSDLSILCPSDSAESVYSAFRYYWDKKLHQTNVNISEGKKSKKILTSLNSPIIHSFGIHLMIAGIFKLFHDIFLFLGPIFLYRLISYLNYSSKDLSFGLWSALGLFVSYIVMSICLRQYVWWCSRVGMRMRSAVITAIFNKSLLLSQGVVSRRTDSFLHLLCDSILLQELPSTLHSIWYITFQILISLYLLSSFVGNLSTLFALLTILVACPLTDHLFAASQRMQGEVQKARDVRLKACSEGISRIYAIKFHAWEREYQEKILEGREKELTIWKTFLILQASAGTFSSSIPLLVALITFLVFIATSNTLDLPTALTSLALLEILRYPLQMLPRAVSHFQTLLDYLDRVEALLLEPEREQVPVLPLLKPGILVEKASFYWEKNRGKKAFPGQTANKWTDSIHLFRSQFLTLNYFRTFFSPASTSPSDSLSFISPQHINGSSHQPSSSQNEKQESEEVKGFIPSDDLELSNEDLLIQMLRSEVGRSEDYILSLETQLSEAQKRIAELNSSSCTDKESTCTRRIDPEFIPQDLHLTDPLSSPTPSPLSSGLVTLSRIDLKAHQGSFIAITGTEGAGKSSLLSALMGEMKCLVGRVSRRGSISYHSQKPFLLNDTLKENIIFGMDFDEGRYRDVIWRVALDSVLNDLPEGDLTEIGEQGYKLTLDQQVRVSLARAIYCPSDLYLLDEPLTAIDPLVGQHILTHAILPLAREHHKTVILTSSISSPSPSISTSPHYSILISCLKEANLILLVDQGRVQERGSLTALLQIHGGSISDLMLKWGGRKHNEKKKRNQRGRGGGNEGEVERGWSNESRVNLMFMIDDNDYDNIIPYNRKKGEDEGEGVNGRREGDLCQKSYLPDSLIDYPCSLSSSPFPSRSTSLSGENENESKAKKRREKETVKAKEKVKKGGEEKRTIDFQVYFHWLNAAGGAQVAGALICLFSIREFAFISTLWWMTHFTSHLNDSSSLPSSPPQYSLPSPWYNLSIFALLLVFSLCLRLLREWVTRRVALQAATTLMNQLLSSVLFAPLTFFESTPMDRIINLFSRDVKVIDEHLPRTLRAYLSTMAKVSGALLFAVNATPLLSLALLPVFAYYYLLNRLYFHPSRDLSRLNSTSCLPIQHHYAETLNGLSTFRAFQAEDRLRGRLASHLDRYSRAYFTQFSVNCCLAVRLEFAGTLIISLVALLAVVGRAGERDGAAPFGGGGSKDFSAMAGLAIYLTLGLSQSLLWTVRGASDLESHMSSVSRLKDYSIMSQEAPQFLPLSDPDATWPEKGEIEFQNVTLRGGQGSLGLTRDLNSVTLKINGGERVGVVGRAGAALVFSLLRLEELNEGRIMIDSTDISRIGLHPLRRKLAFIPKDPALHSGTIRSNLDPFSEYSDPQLWEALRRTTITSRIHMLYEKIEGSGENFSAVQRQLLILSRALLSGARVIMLDEGYPDPEGEGDEGLGSGDSLVQQVVLKELDSLTTLTLSHRRSTLQHCHRILVIEKGSVAEFDTPEKLLNNPSSLLLTLLQE